MGKEVRPVQSDQACEKSVPELVSSMGKEVRLLQLAQALVKSETQKVFTAVLQKYGGESHNCGPLYDTTQPFEYSDNIAAIPEAPGAEDPPPSRFNVPFNWPAISMDTRMLSTLVSSREQLCQA
jgi:hypothetical protein